MDEQTRNVRHIIFSFYLKYSRPPGINDITSAASLSTHQVANALQQLESMHHIVLYKNAVPSPTPIAMAHPFSHIPTPFIVKHGTQSWWANCSWCAFGLASMLLSTRTSNDSVTVVVKSGSIKEGIVFTVTGEGIHTEGDINTCVIHFSVPPSKWWADVRFTCSTIQVFRDQAEVIEWCQQYGFSQGETIDLETMWKLAKGWYEDKASYDYNRKSNEEMENFFAELGLVTKFWAQ